MRSIHMVVVTVTVGCLCSSSYGQEGAAEAFKACADSFPRYASVKTEGLLGAPVGGKDGKGGVQMGERYPDFSLVRMVAGGKLGPPQNGSTPFRRGEIVKVSLWRPRIEPVSTTGNNTLHAESILKHSITRGTGTFEHQSAEELGLAIVFGREGFDCKVARAAWDQLFDPVDQVAADKILQDNPTGVIVDEIKVGMTPAEVQSIMGTPERKADLGSKVVYFYPRMKLTFVGGKLTDVE